MTATALFHLQAHPGHVDDVLGVLRRILVDTRAFAGNLGVAVEQDEAAGEHLVVRSTWESLAHHDAYLAWRAGDGAVHDLGDHLAAAPTTTRLTTVHDLGAGPPA